MLIFFFFCFYKKSCNKNSTITAHGSYSIFLFFPPLFFFLGFFSEKACYLKTGTKEGPNMGKNFYICSVADSRCEFVKQVKWVTFF